jgi:hypothetical protein
MEWKPDEDNGQVVIAHDDDVKRDNAIKYKIGGAQKDESVAVSPPHQMQQRQNDEQRCVD